MNKIKVISNKDGRSGDRQSSFTHYCPSTYRVELDGVLRAVIEFEHFYPLSKINPDWGGRGAWVARDSSTLIMIEANQKLATLKSSIAVHLQEN